MKLYTGAATLCSPASSQVCAPLPLVPSQSLECPCYQGSSELNTHFHQVSFKVSPLTPLPASAFSPSNRQAGVGTGRDSDSVHETMILTPKLGFII